MSSYRPNGKVILLVALILAAGFLLRTYKAVELEKIPHDDVISYLVAAGHLGDYHNLTKELAEQPRWLENRMWRNLLTPEAGAPLASWATTVDDLQQHDIHPPAYFLWLNLVLRALPDVSPWTGWISNSVFFLLNGLLLVTLGWRLLPRPEAALVGLLIWVVAVATIKTALVARHYECLTTISLLSALLLARTYSQRDLDTRSIVLFGVLTTLGFLINYQYLYLGAALSCSILYFHRNQPARVFWCGVTIGGGVLMGLWLYPALLQQSQEVRSWNQSTDTGDLLFRLRNTVEEPLKFSVFATLTIIYIVARNRSAWRTVPAPLYWLTGLTFLFISLTYLGFLTPKHAMGERYLASVWPFLALMLGALVYQYWQHPWYRYAAILLICVPGLLFLGKKEKTPPPPPSLQDAVFVIADFNERGSWPTIAARLPAAQHTLVAPQSSLLDDPSWQSELDNWRGQQGMLISSRSLSGNSQSKQKRLLTMLATTHAISPIKHGDRNLQYLQLIPRESSAGKKP